MERPQLKEDINLETLKQAVKEYLDFIESDDFYEDSLSKYENYIFETIMECLYGDTVWNFVNSKLA